MKKIFSLIKACMTSDMRLFKIKTNPKSKYSNFFLVAFISLCFMISVWSYADMLLEKLAPLHLQHVVLALFILLISIMTLIEGIYKSSSMIFNCKDDQLLLSLPIKRSVVIFIRLFKFYVFELLFNSLFLIPLIIAYIIWADTIKWTFFLTSFIMILFLPIIPIILSCIIGFMTSSIASRFRAKNLVQMLIYLLITVCALLLSFNTNGFLNYITKNANDINDIISKIYYPAGLYSSLTISFNSLNLLYFVLINIIIITIFILFYSRIYFKINSRLKEVSNNKTNKKNKSIVKKKPIIISLIKKELNTFFNTPVFIFNAGFSMGLFVITAVILSFKMDSFVNILNSNNVNISMDFISKNYSLLILILIMAASFMTSITSSVISLEGRRINIIKSLPVSVTTIFASKICSSLILTTPLFFLGDIILFIKFKTGLVEIVMLLLLSIIIPLISHFIGLIINLKYPKLDAENATEVVKQSMSSFISVIIGMLMLVVSIYIVYYLISYLNTQIILLVSILIFLLIDLILYTYLTNKGVNDFNNLSI